MKIRLEIMKKSTLATLLLATLLLGLTPGKLIWAASENAVKKALTAAKAEPPILDGHLNDACWQDAPQATGFTETLPADPKPLLMTSVRL